MEAQENDLSNEAAALADILKWSVDLPAWQRDALRRLCSQTRLEVSDITALVSICKAAEQGVPLDATHVRDPAASHAIVTLGALYGLSNVNALAPGERLSFGKAGLTIIYGDNGAGKSGYARVLKQLCRARSPKGEGILPNIYAAASGTPAASIDFFIGAQKRSAAWTQGTPPDAMLSAVSVFDSRTANVHVENTNDLAYTGLPRGEVQAGGRNQSAAGADARSPVETGLQARHDRRQADRWPIGQDETGSRRQAGRPDG
jgi:energy-coupling factor transporter ATP-binding protein EcfA2